MGEALQYNPREEEIKKQIPELEVIQGGNENLGIHHEKPQLRVLSQQDSKISAEEPRDPKLDDWGSGKTE